MSDTATLTPSDTRAGAGSSLIPTIRLLVLAAGTWKGLLLFAGVLALIAGAAGNQFAMPYALIGVWMAVFNLLRAAETGRLNLLLGSLPVSRRTVITALYLFAASYLVVLQALAWLAAAVGYRLRAGTVADAASAVVGIGTTGLFLAVAIPMVLRFGVQKAMFVTLVLVAATGAIVFGVLDGLPDAARQTSWLDAPGAATTLFAVIGFVALVASREIAARIYEHQDH